MAIKALRNNSKADTGLAIVVVLLFILYIGLSYYPTLILGGLGVLLLMFRVFKLEHNPPLLFYFYSFYLTQIIGVVIYSDFEGKTLEDMFEINEPSKIVNYTLTQLAAIILFSAYTVRKKVRPTIVELIEKGKQFDVKKVLTVYGISTLVIPFLLSATRGNASLSQLIQAFATMRYTLVVLLILLNFLQVEKKYSKIIWAIVVVEFILSFASFFSSFKTILFYLGLSFLTINPNFKIKNLILLSGLLVVALTFMSFWSYIKGDYRAFLNQGSGQQVVNVEASDALQFLTDKLSNFNTTQLSDGIGIFIQRVQYMENYFYVTKRVPTFIPHENGENISKSLRFVLVPRFINEEKGILDPSLKTSYYTGKLFRSAKDGTSISMGYFVDLFIDYGFFWMIIPLLCIAWVIARAYLWMINNKKYNLLFNYALAISVFVNIGTFESDIIFFLGIIKNYLVMLVIGNLIVFPWLNFYMLKKEFQLEVTRKSKFSLK